MPWETLITALFGAGGAGMIAGLLNIVRSRQTGKIEREETLIARLDKSNKEHKDRADAAEIRADEAERETRQERIRANKALDKAALFRRMLIERGHLEDVKDIGIED